MNRFNASTLALFSATALALAGCGVTTEDAGRNAASSTTPMPATTTSGSTTRPTATRPPRRLPTRPTGTVALGSQNNAFSDRLVNDFDRSSNVTVASSRIAEGDTYAALCAGRVDVIQTSVPPTTADYRACSDRGLDIVDPIPLASDAVVIGTRNQSDVGGDCITVRQARDLFRNGSPYTNWNQLGFDDLRIRATGREDGSDNFEFFGLEVLGFENATLGNVRSDFIVRNSDAAERVEVTNEARLADARRRAAAFAARRRRETSGQRRTYVDRAIRAADRRVNAEIRRVNARNKRLKITVDGARLRRTNAALATRTKRDAALRANLEFDGRLNKEILTYRDRLVREASKAGTVGHFSFSYYELFEERIRPMEIDYGTPETASGLPVRFGDLSADDQRRLAPAIRDTLSRQGVTVASGSTGATGAANIDPNTTVPAMDGLPEKTASGDDISPGPNCVFPSQVTITTGAYPLTRRILYVTTKTGLKRPEVRSFLKSALDDVQGLAPSQRLVAITDQQRRDAYIDVTGAPPGDQAALVNPSGTSGTTGSTGTTGASGATGTTGRPTVSPAPAGSIPGVSSGR